MSHHDSIGRRLELDRPPTRIVSLVPSITETLFALGLGDRVVGVTDYCVHPADAIATKPKLGGTKNPRIEELLALAPDLVIANREENRRRDVERIAGAGIPVFVTYARDVETAIREIETLGAIADRIEPAHALARRLERALAEVRAERPDPAPRVVALIWKSPYMAVGADTFADALLRDCGGTNAFAGADGRYPRTDEQGLAAAAPDVILLPTEPYAFEEADRVELLDLDCAASRAGRIHVIEGELLSWYGPRTERALITLSGLLRG